MESNVGAHAAPIEARRDAGIHEGRHGRAQEEAAPGQAEVGMEQGDMIAAIGKREELPLDGGWDGPPPQDTADECSPRASKPSAT